MLGDGCGEVGVGGREETVDGRAVPGPGSSLHTSLRSVERKNDRFSNKDKFDQVRMPLDFGLKVLVVFSNPQYFRGLRCGMLACHP